MIEINYETLPSDGKTYKWDEENGIWLEWTEIIDATQEI